MDTSTPCDEAASASADPSVTLHVCVSCRAGEDADATPRAGLRLHDALVEALQRQDGQPAFKIAAAECLSNCSRGCSAALTGRARWSYVYGDLNEALADELIAGTEQYAATNDGLVPWRERPAIFRKSVIARIPPSVPTV
jgi:predicted metal-binding protein